MSAYVHHLDDSEFVGEIHICNATAPGCVGGDTIIARHHHLSVVVTLYCQFSGFFPLFLFHGEFCRNLDSKCRHAFGEVFKYLLDIAVKNLVNHRRKPIAVFLADSFVVGIHYRDFHLVAGLLPDKPDNRCAFGCGGETVGSDIIIVTDTLAGIASDKENITHLVFKPGQFHVRQCL